jgi:hypothetical protein
VKGIIARAVKIQEAGKLGKFKIGVSTDGKANKTRFSVLLKSQHQRLSHGYLIPPAYLTQLWMKGLYQDDKESIIARAVKCQKAGKFGKFKIGVSKDGKANKPETRLLYSPEEPPRISKESFYDPTGVKGFPAFVYLDNQCAAMVQESGLSPKIKLNTWLGNFLSTGYHQKECGHWGRPALDPQGRVLKLKQSGTAGWYIYSGIPMKYPLPGQLDNLVELFLVTSEQNPTNVVTPLESKESLARIKFNLLTPESDSESESSPDVEEKAYLADILKENAAFKRTVLASKEPTDAVEAARPEIDAMIRQTTKRFEKKKRRKLADNIDGKMEIEDGDRPDRKQEYFITKGRCCGRRLGGRRYGG